MEFDLPWHFWNTCVSTPSGWHRGSMEEFSKCQLLPAKNCPLIHDRFTIKHSFTVQKFN